MQGLTLIQRSRPVGPRPTAVLEGVRTVFISLCVCLVLVASAPVSATVRQVMSDTGETRTAAERTRIYVGMWSTHIRDIDRGLKANSLVGVAYRGYFGATFINSFGDRGIALGIQRNFSPAYGGGVLAAFGYRVGIVTGYDDRFSASVTTCRRCRSGNWSAHSTSAASASNWCTPASSRRSC